MPSMEGGADFAISATSGGTSRPRAKSFEKPSVSRSTACTSA